MSHSSILLALMFLLVYADFTYSKVYYIRPSLDVPCLQNSPCLTFSQFATNSSTYNETDLYLLFLPGNHTLSRELYLSHLNNISMTKVGPGNVTVFVECSSHSGRFLISDSVYVSINGIHFIGCGSNIVSQVEWLTIADATFQGVTNSSAVLMLNEISVATIAKTSFLSNTLNFNILDQPFYSEEEIVDYVYLQRNTLRGVLYTSFSNVSIINCKFMDNTADIGGALVALNSSLYIARTTYSNNTANFGGVMATFGSTIDIDDIIFINNVAHQSGGVMGTSGDSSFNITSTTFSNNYAAYIGGVMATYGDSSFNITSSTFSNNNATYGGVMATYGDSSFNIVTTTFSNNNATAGGIMATSGDSSFNIINTTFSNNNARAGGVMITFGDSSFNIINTTFSNNNAAFGGVMYKLFGDSSFNIVNTTFSYNNATYNGSVMRTYGDSSFNIVNTTFSNNNAAYYGGVMYTSFGDSSFNIVNTTFSNNNATYGGVMRTSGDSSFNIVNTTFSNNNAAYGGVMYTSSGDSSFNIVNTTFTNNRATFSGVICYLGGTLNVDNSNFSLNAVDRQGGGLFFTLQCSTHITNSIFDHNNGSLYIFNGNVNFSGHLEFVNGMEPFFVQNLTTSQEGGVITSFQSTVTFNRGSTVQFSNNQASHGGAILAIESTITVYGETVITNNIATMANSSGGGISLKQSRLEIKGELTISNNSAVRGGGIHASSSTITVYQPGTLQVINNSAELGGGIYLQVNPKLYILKNSHTLRINYFMKFTGNQANYGGAVYVADDTNSGACSPDIECFIQTLALYQLMSLRLNTETMLFSENTASEQGSNIFGGLLDRCIPSPFAEVYQKHRIYYSGVTYLRNIINSNTTLDSISSQPVRVCFCNSGHEPDCSYQPQIISVKKGKTFNVSLVAVDQVNHTVSANITSSLSSSNGGFGEGQQTQSVKRHCTNLTFNVFSPHDLETINLYPDGPCGSAALSTSHVTVQFIDCTCPVGFQPLSNSLPSTRCECGCDSALSPYITDCNVTTSSVLRKGTNSWIAYINDTDTPGYVTYPNCPFDYCQHQAENVSINFNLPKGADSQCAYNRTGVLCGACKDNLSVSLASSRCVTCHTHWPAVLVVILLAAAIAGILLVTVLLALNMTVSVGLINGFIFYANIVSAGSTVFFPSSEPSFPSVFVAWLNLDIGIDVCFIDGLDAYIKTWLQLAFPAYIISLVVMVIIVSEYSPRFAELIGKRDPISTLATLILLSYAKLLSLTITALSSTVLDYPDGKQETVWLPDGNVSYFKGKHIPLALVALLIIIIGLPYTILLFLWQWIVRAPRWKVYKWTRNTKVNAFIASHHVPHNSKFRYWTGLLLLVRIVLYITASFTVSANPLALPLVSCILIGVLVLFKGVFALRVYKNALVDVVDTVLYFNLLALSLFSLYDFKVNITKQTAVVYTSTITTFVLFVVMIFYHVYLLIKKEKPHEDLNEYPLTPVKPAKAEVTHSVIELPKPDQDPPPADKDSDEQEITEDRCIVTPPYNVQ